MKRTAENITKDTNSLESCQDKEIEQKRQRISGIQETNSSEQDAGL